MNQTSSLDEAIRDIEAGLRSPQQGAKVLTALRKAASTGATDDQLESVLHYAERPDALHAEQADCVGAYVTTRKAPTHILMCYLKAQGLTNKEIAKQCDFTETAVSYITKQPWFREMFLDITKAAGTPAVEAFVRGEVMNSVTTLVEVRDDKNCKGSERIAAANSILDRAMGKPAVTVKSETTLNLATAAQTKDEVDRQLAAIQSELQSRGIPVNGAS